MVAKKTLALETYVKRSFNYYTNMVDASGVPYFNIFWIDPAEAAHDWPDSGDVTARQLQAVIMARRMTGVELPIEKVWHQNILSCFDPQTGLIIRPHTPYADGDENVSFMGDQALTLYALVTAYLDRTVRNHLTESQVGDASWLRSDASKSDTEQFTWRDAEEMKVEPNMAGAKTWGNFLHLGHRTAGEMIGITYPLPVYQEEISVGNPGFRQYHYRVTWKGDTVVKMESLGNDYGTGYSDFDKKDVACFYGKAGPGELYQREHLLAEATPELSDIHLDDGSLDFWYIRYVN